SRDADVVVPRTAAGYHPLCAVYRRECAETIARRLAAGRLKVSDLFDDVRTRVVATRELERFGDPDRLLANVNTPADLAAAGARAAEGTAGDRRGAREGARRRAWRRADRGDAEWLSESVSRSAVVSSASRARPRRAGPRRRREDDRRAHGDQSQQGGAHRPS